MKNGKKMWRNERLLRAARWLLALGSVWAAGNALSDGASGVSMLKDLHISQVPMVIR